jgi:hypothetical protein
VTKVSYTIRQASAEDVIGIHQLFSDHLDNKSYGTQVNYDQEKLLSYIEYIISNPIIGVFVSVTSKGDVTGVMSCYVFDSPCNDDRICREFTWISNPRYPSSGLQLLMRLERWAKEQGATRFAMGCTDERVAKLLSRCGYSRGEISYEKVI